MFILSIIFKEGLKLYFTIIFFNYFYCWSTTNKTIKKTKYKQTNKQCHILNQFVVSWRPIKTNWKGTHLNSLSINFSVIIVRLLTKKGRGRSKKRSRANINSGNCLCSAGFLSKNKFPTKVFLKLCGRNLQSMLFPYRRVQFFFWAGKKKWLANIAG